MVQVNLEQPVIAVIHNLVDDEHEFGGAALKGPELARQRLFVALN